MLKKLIFLFLLIGLAYPLISQSNYSISFLENKGQIQYTDHKLAPEVKYLMIQGNLKLFLLKNGLAYQLEHIMLNTLSESNLLSDSFIIETKPSRIQTYRMDMELIGANPNCEIITENKSEDYTNYYMPDLIRAYSYQKIIYKNIYPNIDWVIYTQKNENISKSKEQFSFKYDFIVHPGANPNLIKLKYKNTEQLFLDSLGNLILRNRMGDIRENAPEVFQNQRAIPSNYLINENIISFNIKNYDTSQTLIIDPKLDWSSYYGGNDFDESTGCEYDPSGFIYLYGSTASSNNIAYNGYQNNLTNSLACAFIAKFNSNGQRIWSTYYGSVNAATSTKIDRSKNIIIVGNIKTSMSNYAFNGHQNSYGGGSQDGFIVKFDSAGNRIWASYYGGIGSESIEDCTIDESNSIIFIGTTTSQTGITKNGYQMNYYIKNPLNLPIPSNRFIVKFDSSGLRLWGTYYGVSNGPNLNSCILTDKSNNIYFSGITNTETFVFNSSIILTNYTYYISKLTSSGLRIYGKPIALNFQPNGPLINKIFKHENHIYWLSNPTIGSPPVLSSGFQPTQSGANDIVIFKLDTAANLLWASYCGGNSSEIYPSFASDKHGSLYIGGRTLSSSGIYFRGIDSTLTGPSDLYVTKISSLGTKLWSSYIGGDGIEDIPCLQIDNKDNLYISGGKTNSTTGLSINGHQNIFGGVIDAFLMKLSCAIYDTIHDSICIGDSLFYRNKYYSKPGFYTDSLLTWDICDSFITLQLIINKKDTTYLFDTLCQGQPVIFNNILRSTSGIYRDTLTNSVGCDSLLILNLTIKRVDTTHIYDTSCHNLPKSFNGQSLTNIGIYRDTLINAVGCDSHIFYHFKPKPFFYFPSSISICANDSILFGGQYRSKTGLYFDSLKTKDGCDSVFSLQVNLKRVDTTYRSQSICRGKTFFFNSISQTQSGVYRDTLTNSVGCDSFIILTLSIRDTSRYTYTQSQCSGVPFYFNNTWLTKAGVYRDTLVNAAGCDSFVTMTLSHNKLIYDTLRIIRCFGDNYKSYTQSGEYKETYKSTLGCDSIVTIYLRYLPKVVYQSVYYSRCGSFNFMGNTYTTNDTVVDMLKNQLNCDSLITTNYIVITKPTLEIKELHLDYFCEEMNYKNKLYTNSFYARDTIQSVVYPYCDSIVQPSYFQRESRPQLSLKAIPSDTIIKGESITIEAKGAVHYLWSTGHSKYTITEKLSESKIYSVSAWNLADCEDTAWISITVLESILLDMPLVFSPNGDGLNDILSPNIKGSVQIKSFEIYNRWGEKVYSYSIDKVGWDGSFNNQTSPTGAYSYRLEYSYLKRTMVKTGEVMLVR